MKKPENKSKTMQVVGVPEEIGLDLETYRISGYLDYLENVSYTPLVFEDGRVILIPTSALPPGLSEGDVLEITIRRL